MDFWLLESCFILIEFVFVDQFTIHFEKDLDAKVIEKLKKNLREFYGPLAPVVHDLLVSRPIEAGIKQLHNWEMIRRPSIADYKRWWMRANKIGTKAGRMSVSTKKADPS